MIPNEKTEMLCWLVLSVFWLAIIAVSTAVIRPAGGELLSAAGGESIHYSPSVPSAYNPCLLQDVYCDYEQREIVTRVTEYGATGNRMASGKWPYIGAVATSDRTIPFGTKVIIEGKEYTVEDRTALWVHTERGDTIDIYSNEPSGMSFKTVTILLK